MRPIRLRREGGNHYLAHEYIGELIDKKIYLIKTIMRPSTTTITPFCRALKIASKMGISTLQSHQSAQIFEAVGIRRSVIDKYFLRNGKLVEGIGLEEIAQASSGAIRAPLIAWGLGVDTEPDSIGAHKLRSGDKAEDHLYNPQTIIALREPPLGLYERFKEYTAMVDDERKPHTLRGLLEFKFDEKGGVPLSEAEPASEIVKRFLKPAPCRTAQYPRGHTRMVAMVMNKLGGKSNSGEGGEIRPVSTDKTAP